MNNKINIDVNLASQTHHVPHIGFPHKEPVTRQIRVKTAPIGATDLAYINATRCPYIRPIRLATDIDE